MSFKVEVRLPDWGSMRKSHPDGCYLSVTHNGFQWTGILLENREERQAVIEALQEFDNPKAALNEEEKK